MTDTSTASSGSSHESTPASGAKTAPSDISLNFQEVIRTIGSGFAMGSADIVPGVSGGTMAVACGIYERLLAAIASLNPQSIKALLRFDLKSFFSIVHYRFLSALLFGVALAVVVMVKIIKLPELLLNQPTLVYAVFFGLVFASVFLLGKTVSWTGRAVASLIAGTAIGWLIVTLVPMDMPGTAPFMFLYGTIAISAMLLPGISGSFILLILGQYEHVIGAIESLIHFELAALSIVVPFGIGCLVGITAFSRVVAFLLRKYHSVVVAGLCGLLLGSLWRIWPYQKTVTEMVRGKARVLEATPYWPQSFELSVFLLLLAGFAAVFAVEALAGRRRQGA